MLTGAPPGSARASATSASKSFMSSPASGCQSTPTREAPLGILERLDRAVVGPRDLAQPFADAADALVVVRLHRRVLAEQRAEPRAVVDLHAVLREDARHLAVLLVPDHLGQVLHEVAAARDVQHLEAAADREHRHVARERRLEQRKLAAVALGLVPLVSGCASAP